MLGRINLTIKVTREANIVKVVATLVAFRT
jgi:hypothetical protein